MANIAKDILEKIGATALIEISGRLNTGRARILAKVESFNPGGSSKDRVAVSMINAAEKMEADYAVDIYPYYGSDVEATLRAGWDIKHGLIGAGVYASHGYERSHREGVLNTLKVLIGYIG